MTPQADRALRRAFGRFPTGVTVVTTLTPTGVRHGFTASSFTSVSLDPPMLLVCPGRKLSSFAAFETCQRFTVSVLGEEQEAVARVFAGFKGDRFAQTAWTPDAHGVPLIDGAAAHFSCATAAVTPAGDHVILLGAVDGAAEFERRGLAYAAGQFGRFDPTPEPSAAKPPATPAPAGGGPLATGLRAAAFPPTAFRS